MKTLMKIFVMLIVAGMVFSGCKLEDDCWGSCYHVDTTPPSPPSNVQVVNGDGKVEVYWSMSPENDVAGYNIYSAFDYYGDYELIGSTYGTAYYDNYVENGETYYYAVTAYDENNNESELSYDEAWATPRPEGFNASIFDYLNYPNNSGFSFTSYSAVPYDDETVDFFFENYEGTYYINVYDDTYLQDMGATRSLYDVEWAPEEGWIEEVYIRAIPGHTYVIWTWDNRFAKIRVKSISRDRMVFDWAFQLDEGNPMLKPNIKERSKLTRSRYDR